MSDKPEQPDLSQMSAATRAGLADWDNAAESILSMSKAMIRRVPEPYFKHKLLPIIRNWLQGLPAEVGQWMNVADGMENEIIVVDEKNVELFVCPPPFIAIPPRSEFTRKNRDSAHAIVHAQGLMYDAGEIRKANAIEDNLFEMVVDKPDVALKTAAIDKMIAIYQRYELPLQELLGAHTDEIMASRGAPTTASAKDQAPNNDQHETISY